MSAALIAATLSLAVLMWPLREPPDRSKRPAWRLKAKGAQREAYRTQASPLETLELMALALRGGAALVPSLTAVAESVGGTSGRQLRTVAAALAWGVDEDRAWAEVSAEWAPARRAFSLASRAGVPPARLIEDAARDMQRDRLGRAETAAAQLTVRLVLPLGLALLPAFIFTTVLPVVVALASDVLRAGL